MSATRRTVGVCPSHGLVEVTFEDCPVCGEAFTERFDVIRATGARSKDPSTSKLAALAAEPTFETDRGKVLDAIRAAGEDGLTAREAERVTGTPGVWRRVSELKQGGHIHAVGERRDPATHKAGQVFVVTAQAPAPAPATPTAGDQMGLL